MSESLINQVPCAPLMALEVRVEVGQKVAVVRGLSSFLYLSVGEKETEQMIGGFNKMVGVLNKNRKKKLRWVADYTPFAVHQDNVLISTSKRLAEWGGYLKEIKNRTLWQGTRRRATACIRSALANLSDSECRAGW